MTEDNTIKIGGDENSPYIAYGDESSYKQNLSYVYVIVPRSKISHAEERIQALKKRYKFPADEPIHS